MISLACVRDMLEVVLAYVPAAQRETARAAGLAIGIGHAIDADKPKRAIQSQETHAKRPFADVIAQNPARLSSNFEQLTPAPARCSR